MKKDKKTETRSFWKLPPTFLKNLFIYIIFAGIFAIVAFILIYRYVNKINMQQEFVYQALTPTPAPAPAPVPVPEAAPAPVPEPAPVPVPEYVLLQNEVTAQNNRLAQVETIQGQLQPIAQLSHQLLATEILRDVLEGHLPLSTFTLYLQKIPEPWAPPILSSISTITECKTYAQLQASLAFPPQACSLWRRVKNKLKSFVRIRKLDARGQYLDAPLEDIHKALREYNIQQALELFGKLPLGEKAKLSLWEQDAQHRLTLETLKQKMLLDLAGS